MLKNRNERRKFIENEDNWKILDSYLEGLRVKELDLGDKVVNVIEVKTYITYLKKEKWVAESMRWFNKSKCCYELSINTNKLIDYLTEHKKDEVIKDFNNDLLEDVGDENNES